MRLFNDNANDNMKPVIGSAASLFDETLTQKPETCNKIVRKKSGFYALFTLYCIK